jgi:hypothetical protein
MTCFDPTTQLKTAEETYGCPSTRKWPPEGFVVMVMNVLFCCAHNDAIPVTVNRQKTKR